jgi:hypothetical protein
VAVHRDLKEGLSIDHAQRLGRPGGGGKGCKQHQAVHARRIDGQARQSRDPLLMLRLRRVMLL